MQVALQPCGSARARQNFKQVNIYGIDLELLRPDLPEGDFHRLEQMHPTGAAGFWAVKDSPRTSRQFDRLRRGDTVVFGGNGRYFATARCGVKFRHPLLATLLWGTGNRETLFYSLLDISPLDLSYREVNEALGLSGDSPPRAFRVIDAERSDDLLGLLEDSPTPDHFQLEVEHWVGRAASHDRAPAVLKLREKPKDVWEAPTVRGSSIEGRIVTELSVADDSMLLERSVGLGGHWSTAKSPSQMILMAREILGPGEFYSSHAVLYSWGLGQHLEVSTSAAVNELGHVGDDGFNHAYGFVRISSSSLDLMWQARPAKPTRLDQDVRMFEQARPVIGFWTANASRGATLQYLFDTTATTPLLFAGSRAREVLQQQCALLPAQRGGLSDLEMALVRNLMSGQPLDVAAAALKVDVSKAAEWLDIVAALTPPDSEDQRLATSARSALTRAFNEGVAP